MKKTFFCLLIAAMPIMTVIAQNVPKHIPLHIEEFAYKPSKGSVALTLLSVASDSKGLWLPDKSMVPQMNEAVVSGAVNIPWIDKADKASASYTLKGHFTQTEIMTGDPESVIVRARTTIIDNKTGKTVGTKIVQGTSMTPLSYESNTTMKTRAAMDFA